MSRETYDPRVQRPGGQFKGGSCDTMTTYSRVHHTVLTYYIRRTCTYIHTYVRTWARFLLFAYIRTYVFAYVRACNTRGGGHGTA